MTDESPWAWLFTGLFVAIFGGVFAAVGSSEDIAIFRYLGLAAVAIGAGAALVGLIALGVATGLSHATKAKPATADPADAPADGT